MPGIILGTGDAMMKTSVSLMSLSLHSSSRKHVVNFKHRVPSGDKKNNEWQKVTEHEVGGYFGKGSVENTSFVCKKCYLA